MCVLSKTRDIIVEEHKAEHQEGDGKGKEGSVRTLKKPSGPVTQLAKRTSARFGNCENPEEEKSTCWDEVVMHGNEVMVTSAGTPSGRLLMSPATLSRVIGAPPNGSLWQLVYAVPLRKLSEESQVQPSRSC